MGMELEKVSEGTLIFKAKLIRDLANRLRCCLEQVAGLMIDPSREVIVDGGAGNLFHHPAEVGRRDAELVGIEQDLSLLTEIHLGEMEKDLIDVLLMSEVGREDIVFERQFADEQFDDVYERLYHLRFVEMHVMDGFLYL